MTLLGADAHPAEANRSLNTRMIGIREQAPDGRLRARRREQERTAAEIASDTRDLAPQLTTQLPVSDAAVSLGVSKGRITQLRGKPEHSADAPRRTARMDKDGDMTLKRYPPLPRAEGSGGTPGKCDRCGNLAPKGKRICRPCRRRISPDPPRTRKGRLDIPYVEVTGVCGICGKPAPKGTLICQPCRDRHTHLDAKEKRERIGTLRTADPDYPPAPKPAPPEVPPRTCRR